MLKNSKYKGTKLIIYSEQIGKENSIARQKFLVEKRLNNVELATKIKATKTGKPICTPNGIINPLKLDINNLGKNINNK